MPSSLFGRSFREPTSVEPVIQSIPEMDGSLPDAERIAPVRAVLGRLAGGAVAAVQVKAEQSERPLFEKNVHVILTAADVVVDGIDKRVDKGMGYIVDKAPFLRLKSGKRRGIKDKG